MEFNREYDAWKRNLADYIVAPLTMRKIPRNKKEKRAQLQHALMHHLDRLFFTACLATLRKGDVYSAGAKHRVPELHLIRSYNNTRLGQLSEGESFRLRSDSTELFEILVKLPAHVVVRNVEGYVFSMTRDTDVYRESNLTRDPDGNQESKVVRSLFFFDYLFDASEAVT
jgi:hypothetical protein